MEHECLPYCNPPVSYTHLDVYKRQVFVDLFGGSGLLSHITKRERPDATVIYNDHDNYRERLENISRTNALLSDLRRLSEGIPRHRMLSKKTVSYTHLDVYKRQRQPRGIQPESEKSHQSEVRCRIGSR